MAGPIIMDITLSKLVQIGNALIYLQVGRDLFRVLVGTC